MTNELKPCPFCAGEATLDGKSDYCRARCLKCGTQGQSIYFDHNEDEDYSVEELQAIAAWNRRAPVERQAPEWMPIETAPKDANILLFCKGFGVVRGYWQADKYATKPRPYWTNDRETVWGKLRAREDQPTHWMPLPASPSAAPSAPGREP